MGLGKLPWEIRVSPGGHGWPGERHQVLVLCHYLDTLTTIYPHLPATHISAEASQKSREWEFVNPACPDPHKANTPHNTRTQEGLSPPWVFNHTDCLYGQLL